MSEEAMTETIEVVSMGKHRWTGRTRKPRGEALSEREQKRLVAVVGHIMRAGDLDESARHKTARLVGNISHQNATGVTRVADRRDRMIVGEFGLDPDRPHGEKFELDSNPEPVIGSYAHRSAVQNGNAA